MKTLKTLSLIVCTVLCLQNLNAQPRMRADKPEGEKTETTDEKKTDKPKEPGQISKLMEGVSPMVGLTPVYIKDSKYYIEIADSLIGRDLLMVSRIAECAAGFRKSFMGYSGDQLQEGMFRFAKGPDHKIFLTEVIAKEQSRDSLNSMYQNVQRSNRPAIIAAWDIKAYNADKTSALIDITEFVKSDNESIYFPKPQKTNFKFGALQNDKSYVESVKTFPINTEMRSVKTYPSTSSGGYQSFVLNVSFVLLPKVPMQFRYADSRVGYFTSNYSDFDLEEQTYKLVRMIARWRLEPKPEDMEKYRRGELVEPAKPIVYYIDPTTPKQWVPYLIQGVNDWQVAFEKAGFKNAIYAREAPTPEEDPSWSLEDARNSAIVYKPSTIANASGPHVSDPRSGEIIESHINWYHNVMSLVHHWYFVQCAATDPQARTMTFSTELMGQLVRFVSSHEVGHTLGLRHNFAGSNQYTAEQLRDTAFIRKNGHTTSIMDYSRFNFVAQPEDGFPQELLFPRISHYDLWSIEWGYRRFLDITNPEDEVAKLNQWIIEKSKDPYMTFNPGGEGLPDDPRGQAEDLGENQMIANELGIKNLKRIIPQLPEWTKVANQEPTGLRIMHDQVVSQYSRYMVHVAKWVGAIFTNYKTVEQDGPIHTFPSKDKQIEAMDFLKRNVFTTPTWLVPEYTQSIMGRKPSDLIEPIYKNTINTLVNKDRVNNMLRAEFAMGSQAYTTEDFFQDMDDAILGNYGSTDAYTRTLQNVYIDQICKLIDREHPTGTSMLNFIRGNIASPYSDVDAVLRAEAVKLEKNLKKASGDARTKAHYQLLYQKIHKMLEQ